VRWFERLRLNRSLVQSGRRASGVIDHAPHLGNHALGIERLVKETTVQRKIDRLLQVSRYDDDLDQWPAFVNRLGKLQSVHAARHLDVGDHQVNVRSGLQDCDGAVGIHSLNRRVAGVFHHVDGAHPDHHLVFDDENDRERTYTIKCHEMGAFRARHRRRLVNGPVEDKNLMADLIPTQLIFVPPGYPLVRLRQIDAHEYRTSTEFRCAVTEGRSIVALAHLWGDEIWGATSHMSSMGYWQTSIKREQPKTKSELRQMLAEAVRNTQPSAKQEPKKLSKVKAVAAKTA